LAVFDAAAGSCGRACQFVAVSASGALMSGAGVALHMIEETARHAGHLDIARELIDGQTGLGPR
jgi:hypothetical protein